MLTNENDLSVDEFLAAEKPDWFIHPLTKTKIFIGEVFSARTDFACPACEKTEKHTICVLLESDEFIICCTQCQEFIFCDKYFKGINNLKEIQKGGTKWIQQKTLEDT